MRLLTKQSRTELLNAIINRRKESGHSLEIYKGLQILTKQDQERKHYSLEVYRDNSTKPICNFYYREHQHQQMLDRIESCKSNYDSNQRWKAEQKEKNKGRLTGAAACAAAIRAELKNNFEGFKFSVTADTFANGNAVRINWVDGPTVEQVESFTSKYQYGHFDGMTDMYEYTNSRDDLPQAKYVQTQRSMSEETKAVLEPIAAEMFQSDEHYRNADNVLYRLFRKCSLPFGAKVTGIERTEITCGSHEDFYMITHSLQLAPKKEIEKVAVETGRVDVIEYSEKAIAVIGDTYPIKDKLKELGGKFNRFLSCGAGWIFPKSKLSLLQNELS